VTKEIQVIDEKLSIHYQSWLLTHIHTQKMDRKHPTYYVKYCSCHHCMSFICANY